MLSFDNKAEVSARPFLEASLWKVTEIVYRKGFFLEESLHLYGDCRGKETRKKVDIDATKQGLEPKSYRPIL